MNERVGTREVSEAVKKTIDTDSVDRLLYPGNDRRRTAYTTQNVSDLVGDFMFTQQGAPQSHQSVT